MHVKVGTMKLVYTPDFQYNKYDEYGVRLPKGGTLRFSPANGFQ